MKRPLRILIVVFCFFFMHKAHAQYFEFGKVLGDTSISQSGRLIAQLQNNSYLIASDGGVFRQSYYWHLYKTNNKGDSVFSVTSANLLNFRFITAPQSMTILSSNTYSINSAIIDSGAIKLVRLKCDSIGKNTRTLYNKYPLSQLDSVATTHPELHVKYIPNECFYIYGQSPDAVTNSYVIWKIDTGGKMLWRQDYYDTLTGFEFNLVVLKNKILMTSGAYTTRWTGVRLLWMDTLGNVTKENTVGPPFFIANYNAYFDQHGLAVLPDTSIVMGCDGPWAWFNWPLLLKFKPNLDTAWHRYVQIPRDPKNIDKQHDLVQINKIVVTADSNIAVWWYKSFNDFNSRYTQMLDQYKMDGRNVSRMEVDSVEPYYPMTEGVEPGLNDMIATADNGFAFEGSITTNAPINKSGTYLMKLSNSVVTTLEEPLQNMEGISLYPNPAASSITLHSTNEFQNAEIKIYNLQGQQIQGYSHISGKEFLILRNNAPQGLYILQITTNNKSQTLKFAWQAN